jgi:hypothetical protein
LTPRESPAASKAWVRETNGVLQLESTDNLWLHILQIGGPFLFGFPNSSAREYVQQEGLRVLSDTPGLEYICIAEVVNTG